MIERKGFSGFDGLTLVVIFLILGAGLLTLYSLQPVAPFSLGRTPFYLKQTVWILVGAVVFLVMASVDYHLLARWAYPVYALTIILLVGVLVAGRSIQGARRWISLGFFSIQPSELAKLSLLFVLAKYFSTHNPRQGLRLGDLFVPGLLAGLPLLLILKQPDLGTGLTLLSIFAAMIFVLGLHSKVLIYSTLVSLLTFPFLWLFFWNHLKDYQKERLLTFISPGRDPSGSGYHIAQSKIAVGSGQTWGRGFFGGTQGQLKFLPEGHTDFIFSVFSEAWGFAGVAVLLTLFLLLLLWGIDIALNAKDLLGTLLTVGIIGLLAFHVLVNVGMTLGNMPTVGIPLPLVSYGGTAMVATMALLGLLLNVKLRRFMLFY
jgi:rod shape determining protein RodA